MCPFLQEEINQVEWHCLVHESLIAVLGLISLGRYVTHCLAASHICVAKAALTLPRALSCASPMSSPMFFIVCRNFPKMGCRKTLIKCALSCIIGFILIIIYTIVCMLKPHAQVISPSIARPTNQRFFSQTIAALQKSQGSTAISQGPKGVG